MPIVTENNIVPLVHTALTGLALIIAAWAKLTADANHKETLRHIQRLDDHNNSVGVAVATALADSVPITSVAALSAAAKGEGTQ